MGVAYRFFRFSESVSFGASGSGSSRVHSSSKCGWRIFSGVTFSLSKNRQVASYSDRLRNACVMLTFDRFANASAICESRELRRRSPKFAVSNSSMGHALSILTPFHE